MSFLRSIRFTKSLKVTITPGNQQLVLDCIRRKISEREADGVVMTAKQVKYQGSTSEWGRAIFNSVDRGEFKLIQKEGKWFVVYKIYVGKSLFRVSFTISSAAGIVMQLGEGKWWIGLLVFLWFYWLSFIITAMRHDILGEDIVQEINKLLTDEQPEIQNQDGGKLKSWF